MNVMYLPVLVLKDRFRVRLAEARAQASPVEFTRELALLPGSSGAR